MYSGNKTHNYPQLLLVELFPQLSKADDMTISKFTTRFITNKKLKEPACWSCVELLLFCNQNQMQRKKQHYITLQVASLILQNVFAWLE